MKAFLMHRDRDFDLAQPPPSQEEALVQDLELGTLFAAMSANDDWLAKVVRKVVVSGLTDTATIRYRQNILRDSLRQEAVVREIYDLSVETINTERKNAFWGGSRNPDSILYRSVQVLEMLVGMLHRLRGIADQNVDRFESEGFRTLFTMLRNELSDAYFEIIRQHLKQLKFQKGVLISAQLGDGARGFNYVLRKENTPHGDWLERNFTLGSAGYSFHLADRDESGARALSELRDRGINLVANALAQSTDHILSFFNMLRTELAFYVGCLNLHARLAAFGGPICFPRPTAPPEHKYSATALYDICLALNLGHMPVGNDLSADGKDLILVTGANQGGKSTFLRSIGLSHLMMRCGMFVAATLFHANVCEQILTHYKREEDAAMKSGKFDEELSRMSDIIDDITPNSLLLFNESFASTNEREGSEVARQIVTFLIERGIKIVFVTHQYELAHAFQSGNRQNVMFLRAERQDDGARTFKITEGEPLRTSFGQDLYDRIFVEPEDA